MSREIAGLSEVIDAFDGVLIDQFGVLHDGVAAFPGTVECLEHVAKRQMPVVALTNSGKRGSENAARLATLGFRDALFAAVVSSGEVARFHIEAMLAEGSLQAGARVAVVSRGEIGALLDGLPVEVVATAPDLLVIAGAEPERIPAEAYAARLRPFAEARVPALLVNPDRLMTTPEGPLYGPGVIADAYRAAGGTTATLGKPAAAMFEAGLAALGGIAPERVLMIGDSPEHDIAGAAALGIRTLLIKGGVQAGLASSARPDFEIDGLRW